jgi:hypothetical protein
MLSKCANPECLATFLYFHLGKLFRLETESGTERRRLLGGDSGKQKALRRVEFYWLCESCAKKMTLKFEKGVGVSVQPHAVAEQVEQSSEYPNAARSNAA